MAISLGNRFGDNQISYTKFDPSMSHTFSGNIHLAKNLKFAYLFINLDIFDSLYSHL